MSRLIKIVDNKYVQIEEYKNPNICFNTNEYNNFEDYCTLREIFDPFEIFYENQELKDNWNKLRKYFNERIEVCGNRLSTPFCNFEKATKEILIFSQCLEKLEELERGNSNE